MFILSCETNIYYVYISIYTHVYYIFILCRVSIFICDCIYIYIHHVFRICILYCTWFYLHQSHVISIGIRIINLARGVAVIQEYCPRQSWASFGICEGKMFGVQRFYDVFCDRWIVGVVLRLQIFSFILLRLPFPFCFHQLFQPKKPLTETFYIPWVARFDRFSPKLQLWIFGCDKKCKAINQCCINHGFC